MYPTGKRQCKCCFLSVVFLIMLYYLELIVRAREDLPCFVTYTIIFSHF